MAGVNELLSEQLRPLRRHEYDQLIEWGAFAEDERVELLDGLLVEMSPQKPPHAWVLRWLTKAFVTALGDRAEVQVQLPLALSDRSQPEPDLALIPSGDYRRQHPSHAYLIVEVADASARKDEVLKARLYAAAGIEDYWVVNLRQGVVRVHRDPSDAAYAAVTEYRTGSIRLLAFPDVSISALRLLGIE